MENRFDKVQNRSFVDIGARVLDENERRVELSFSSEDPIERYGGFEILEHKKSSVDLKRLATTGCLLFNHNRDKVIGKIEKCEVKEGRGVAVVVFDDDEESNIIYKKVVSGSLRGVSVGYIVNRYLREVKGESNNLIITYRITKWTPYEISIVSVPADITVGVGRAMDDSDEVKHRSLTFYEAQLKLNQNMQNTGRM